MELRCAVPLQSSVQAWVVRCYEALFRSLAPLPQSWVLLRSAVLRLPFWARQWSWQPLQPALSFPGFWRLPYPLP